ncbi:NAD(P)/FAD-dependent oxidoreductase [Acholeplasma sp. OttesenSCG-928-E16]|nr:NAD(P)/FAD-dependent oxidoreductase [Acholeplasma sp. OttesenSCG-928-E16]
MIKKDIVIIGGGAAGLASAINAKGSKTLLIERDNDLGGILNQCIHNGFGLHIFKEELTGPEYANRFIELFKKENIDFLLNSTVLKIEKPNDFLITASNESGIVQVTSKAVILAAGCYERTRGAIMLPGERPKGIMPAGSAQRYLNIDGYLVGKKVFILGSGDIGLIMARRMKLEGAEVLGVAEIMPYSNGLTRNIVQCLNDFNIPLYLSHTVTFIKGKDSLEAITISKVDQNFIPIPNTEKRFEVDTLLLSVGLVPDVALLNYLPVTKSPITKSVEVNQFYETNIDGLFACGNALHVHDLVDFVTKESEKAGRYAHLYCLKEANQSIRNEKKIVAGKNIRYTVPQKIDFNNIEEPIEILFRVSNKFPDGTFNIIQDGKVIKTKKAKFIAPAEMEKLILNKKDFISDGEITLELEVNNE